ncbi:apolipoprotein d [Stylonychia lemnae]|uniref:Apolipoprotein d n=1 Tax=Stylonychia lemnae TaxID=5949 RepID=A0A078AYY6_STYLE|nr:apolipoprotein d [Stylonychia lemnae]|eukprot:CDW86008.1 apolipoprotein d [Stylonychia lemnae]
MQKKILFLSATLALINVAHAGAAFGSCAKVELQQNFDATRYVGTWFEQVRDKSLPFEKYDCQQAIYSLQGEGLLVHNTQYNPTSGLVEEAYANATCKGAACEVKFNWYSPAGDYRVLDTDYENYSLVYSCTNIFGLSKFHFVWLLTRKPELTADITKKVTDVLKARVSDYEFSNFHVTKQLGDCKYIQ